MRWISFDCFGTLVDWRRGFTTILTPIAGAKTPALLHTYHRIEPELESTKPHQLYKDVLATGVRRSAQEVGVTIMEADAQLLGHSWGSLPVFADVEPMLADLRRTGFRLAVLTNCDDELFAATARAFRVPFDMVITAEQVFDYKPSLAHFRRF